MLSFSSCFNSREPIKKALMVICWPDFQLKNTILSIAMTCVVISGTYIDPYVTMSNSYK